MGRGREGVIDIFFVFYDSSSYYRITPYSRACPYIRNRPFLEVQKLLRIYGHAQCDAGIWACPYKRNWISTENRKN